MQKYLFIVTYFVHSCVLLPFYVTFWSSGAVVVTGAQFHSTKTEFRFCVGPNPVRCLPEIRDGEDL